MGQRRCIDMNYERLMPAVMSMLTEDNPTQRHKSHPRVNEMPKYQDQEFAIAPASYVTHILCGPRSDKCRGRTAQRDLFAQYLYYSRSHS